MQHKLNNYQKVAVETTDPIQLVVMLFEGAINFTEQAKLRLREKDIAEKSVLISKALAIVSELQGSLNMEKGGEVAGNMDRIYSYLRYRLMEANVNNDSGALDEVLNHLRNLNDAWKKTAVKADNRPQPPIQMVHQPTPLPSPRPAAGGYKPQGLSRGEYSAPRQSGTGALKPIEIMG